MEHLLKMLYEKQILDLTEVRTVLDRSMKMAGGYAFRIHSCFGRISSR